MMIPVFEPSQGILFNTGIATGNGGGAYINEYTMVFDIYWTESSWFSFYNAESVNVNNDGDFFRRPSDGAIGVGNGGYFGSTQNHQWYRVAFTVQPGDEDTINIYLDGYYLGTAVRFVSLDGRFSLYRSVDVNKTLLFGDDNGETGTAYVSQFYFDNRVYSGAEIMAMGGANAAPIPEPGTQGSLLIGLALLWRTYRMRRYALNRAG